MRILILTNNDGGLYHFRKELLEKLIELGHQVDICLPNGTYIEQMKEMGCSFIACDLLDRHGTNPFKELALIRFYHKIIKVTHPDIVFTYTIKPNVYGGIVCGMKHIPYIENITGLGSAVENSGIMQKITLCLYRFGVRKAKKVFFQNQYNQDYMLSHHIVAGDYDLLPGSGVDLQKFTYMDYEMAENTKFLIIGRMMKDKGTDEVLEAAKIIRKKYPDTMFTFIGDADESGYREKIEQAQREGNIRYEGIQSDVRPYIKECSAVIHASYHEGMSNVLLEAAASGRPVIATDVPGCIDTYIPEVSGIAFRAKNANSLVEALERFLALTVEQRQKMGQEGRKYVEEHFDRNIVIQKYVDELKDIKES